MFGFFQEIFISNKEEKIFSFIFLPTFNGRVTIISGSVRIHVSKDDDDYLMTEVVVSFILSSVQFIASSSYHKFSFVCFEAFLSFTIGLRAESGRKG